MAADATARHPGSMPEPTTATPSATSPGVLPAPTRLGPVQLVVSDLERSLAFYEGVLGLRRGATDRDAGIVGVGSGGEDLVLLREDRGARPAGRHVGLYHVALNSPTREELARVGLRLAASRTPIQGASDHHTHEAIYLADPDGNGLELAADRPRAAWPSPSEAYDLDLRPPAPLDLQALLDVVGGEDPTPEAAPGVFVGHVHLHVGDLDPAERFWGELVGLERQARLSSAAFLSAGGYHHHVAVNTWRGAAPRPAGTVGLDHLTVRAPADAVAAAAGRLRDGGVGVTEHGEGGVRASDPAGNVVQLVPEG